MDSGYPRSSNVKPTSQNIPSLHQTKPPLRSSVASLHGSHANHSQLVPPREKPARLFSWHLLLPVFSLLWLVPMATLLALNYTNHVIGASAWCPRGRCSADPLTKDAFQKAKQLDKADHTTLGALQLVAKALETWFVLIATSMVYDLSMIFATKGNGLPLGYFLTHLQVGDIRLLFNPLLWTSWNPNPNMYEPNQLKQPKQIKQTRRFKLCMFAVIVIFLTILTNLMGPATAVLVLPTLQWVDTRHVPEQRFQETGAARPPRLSSRSGLPGCDKDDFSAHNYSCTWFNYGPMLDSLATSAYLMFGQGIISRNPNHVLTSQENSLKFSVNGSEFEELVWVPNRQVLASLDD